MSIHSYSQQRRKLSVPNSEHVLSVTKGNDGETYAVCYGIKVSHGSIFAVRYTKGDNVLVDWHWDLFSATQFVDKHIVAATV